MRLENLGFKANMWFELIFKSGNKLIGPTPDSFKH